MNQTKTAVFRQIKTLAESPCSKCQCEKRCMAKIERSPKLRPIYESMMSNALADYRKCGIYIALNADPKLVERRLTR